MKLGIGLFASVFALQACAPIVKYRDNIEEHVISGKPLKSDLFIEDGNIWRKVTDADRLGAFNSETIVQRRPDSVAIAPPHRARGPQVCLALSGGGIRSATFNIGVLGALHREGLLDQVEVMSSVSGGGYALAWFYMQHYWEWKHRGQLTKKDIADLRDRMFSVAAKKPEPSQKAKTHQAYLLEHSRLMREIDYAAMIAPQLAVAVPVHLVANGLFSWRENIGLPYDAYRQHLETTFLRGPDAPENEPIPDIAELARFSREAGMPVFSLNATAWPGTTKQEDLELRDAVYSFTSDWHGSGAFGRYRYGESAAIGAPYPLPVTDVVALSGAAVDGNTIITSRMWQTVESALAFDLGGYIPNPAVSREERAKHRRYPFPMYFAYRHDIDVRGIGIYLSDGGHAENLALYPLIVRNCAHIIEVDGEFDPTYEFGSYKLLQNNVTKEFGMRIDVPEIDNAMAIKEEDACAIAKEPVQGRRWQYFSQRRAMKGELDLGGEVRADIYYAKLAYTPTPPKPPHTYYGGFFGPECTMPTGNALDDYYYCIEEKRERGCFPLGVSEPFPQQPTKDQNYSSEQFHAYVLLGDQFGVALAQALEKQRATTIESPRKSRMGPPDGKLQRPKLEGPNCRGLGPSPPPS